jgi:hypothetical protein
MLEYKGYKISGESIPMYMEGCESLGSVCKPGRNGSVIEVARSAGVDMISRDFVTDFCCGVSESRLWGAAVILVGDPVSRQENCNHKYHT